MFPLVPVLIMGNVRIPSLEALSARIIQDVQPEMDGGVVQFVLKSDILKGSNKNTDNILQQFMDYILSKGRYEASIALGVIWCIAIPMVTLIFLIWSCHVSRSKCCPANTKLHHVWNTLITKVYSQLFKSSKDPHLNFSKKPIHVRSQPNGRCMMMLLVVNAVILAMFFSGLMVAYSANNPLQWTMDDDKSPSLKASINESLSQIEQFFVGGILNGSNLTTTTINSFSESLQDIVKRAVSTFTDDLLFDYGVKTLFDIATKVIGDIQSVLASMQFIYDSQITVFKRLNEFKGFIDTIRGQLDILSKLCNLTQTGSEFVECQRLKQQQSQLIVSINQSKINFESSTSTLFLLREMSLNISSVAVEMTNARTSIDSMLSSVYTTIQKDFNLDSVFGSLDDLWATADTVVYKEVLSPLYKIQGKGNRTGTGQISSIINTVSSARKVTLGMIGLAFFLSIVCGICLIVMIVSIHFGRKRQLEYMVGHSNGDCFNENGDCEDISKDAKKRFLRRRYEAKVPVSVFTCFVLFLGFMTVLPTAIVVASFFIGGALQNELCRYVAHQDGLQITDANIDRFISQNWDNWTRSLNISLGELQITVNEPHGVLDAIVNRCGNHSENGLLDIVGVKDVLDVDALLKSSMFSKMINSGKGFAKDTIGKLNGAAMIPNSLTPILQDATNLTKMLVDDIQYQQSIRELEKPLLQIDSFTQFVADLDAYVRRMRLRHPSNNDIRFMLMLLDTLQKKNPEYLQLVKLLAKVLKNFILLQQTRTISSGLTRLVENFKKVRIIMSNSTRMTSVVDPIYDQVMVSTVRNISLILKSSIKTLEKGLLPCSNLSAAFNTTVNSVCNVFLPEFNAFSIAYGWCLLWFQILIVTLWILLRKVRRQQLPVHSEC